LAKKGRDSGSVDLDNRAESSTKKGRDSGGVNLDNRAESSTKNPQTEEVRIKVEDDANEVVPSAQKKRKIEVFDDFIDLTRDAETST
jgi:hypothetical protein